MNLLKKILLSVMLPGLCGLILYLVWPSSILNDFDTLESNLKQNLFGQPLVSNIVMNALRGHINDQNPKKALVISFHGSTGVGKNYVTQLVLDAIFREGAKSDYVKIFVNQRDFPNVQNIEKYKKLLTQSIESTVRKYARSFFIFDECNQMPHGLLEVLKPYLDFHESLGGVDYRKSVFIFLSNLGAGEIDRMTLDFSLKDIERERFKLKPFQDMLQNLVLHDKNWKLLAEKELIDFYVPFLPLERHHVKLCASKELRRFGYQSDDALIHDIDNIADQMEYVPKDHKKYSSSGCKRVAQFAKAYAVKRAQKQKRNYEF